MGINDDNVGFKAATASAQKAGQEWAIQDEATGAWYNAVGLWNKDDSHIARYDSYPLHAAFIIWDSNRHRAVRIVPAPPREMTNDECWEWFHLRGFEKLQLRPSKTPGDTWYVNVRGHELMTGCFYGPTPCDAIRAARKKLEGK